MRQLALRIYQLDDGRFFVRYSWGWWQRWIHAEYFNTPEALGKFIEELLKGATEQRP